jgi:hypothetical protein
VLRLRTAERERVRHRHVGDRHPRLRYIGHHAQALDDRMQVGRLSDRHLSCAHRLQRDLVRGQHLDSEEGGGYHQHDRNAAARTDRDPDQDHINQTQQEHREQHPDLQAGIATELAARHHPLLIVIGMSPRLVRLHKSSHGSHPRIQSVLARTRAAPSARRRELAGACGRHPPLVCKCWRAAC